ncbi:MAG: phycobilisome linker polypeptide [Cyanophyceae cyanobacterium]
MFGQTTQGSGNVSDLDNRMYRIEVEGMGQNTNPNRVSYRIRSTGKTYITVSYDRMSEQMQRINRMGGKILSIEPLTADGSSQAKMEATGVHQNLNASGKPKTVGADGSGTEENPQG